MQVKPAPTKHRAVLGQLSDMDLRLLQVFKAVAECGGCRPPSWNSTSAPAPSAAI